MTKFKIAKMRMNSADALVTATSIASIVAHVSDMLQFFPARAAASVVLIILQTVQQIDSNKVACYKLARRSAKILIDLKVRMEGRWDTAPKALVENIQEYEKVLVCIRDFMQELNNVGWMGRLLKKGSIEDALSDFHGLLDEAERAFQVASLVEIHYTVGILEKRSANKDIEFVEDATCRLCLEEETLETILPCSGTFKAGPEDKLAKSHIKEDPDIQEELGTSCLKKLSQVQRIDDVEELQLQEELKELDRFGFKRYHQTDLCLLSDAKFSRSDSFWKETMLADNGGTRVLVKRYDSSETTKKNNLNNWLHDIRTLRNLYHPNLPQLVGYSDEKSPVPFILLAQAKLHDPCTFLLDSLRNMSISELGVAAVKIYRDILSAALYIQRQLSFDERETQVFIAEASYALDKDTGKIIVGVPPPKYNEFRGFGYPLVESLLSTTMQILPSEQSLTKNISRDVAELQDKVAHVRAIAQVLLPCVDQCPELSDFSKKLLETEDPDSDYGVSSAPLAWIRRQAVRAGMHEFAWHAGIHSCSNVFAVGDIGYISRDRGRVPLTDKSRFDHFVKIGNVIGDPSGGTDISEVLSIIREVNGIYGQWIEGFHKSEEAWPFVLPADVEGWPVSLSVGSEVEVHVRHTARMASVSQAWHRLQECAEDLASKSGVNPEELVLITKTVSGQIYKVHDWSPARPTFFRHQAPFRHGAPQFPHGIAHQQQLPRMLYLFTSYRDDFTPCLNDRPIASSFPHGHISIRNVSLSTAWHKPEAFIGYIQLSAEDFGRR